MMSLINTLHMAVREERFTEASNAPITDGSRCRPGIPFSAHPPVFFFFFFPRLLFSSPVVTDAIGLSAVREREGAHEFCLRSTMKDTSVYQPVLFGGLPQEVM